MKKQRHITYKVWLEIEKYNERTGSGETMDAPGSYLAEFDTYEEAWNYAERILLDEADADGVQPTAEEGISL